MASSNDTNGILFIFESDGYDWANHLSSLLINEYDIQCFIEHWWNLNEQIASSYPVHVLLLSPLMEPHTRHKKFSYLRNESQSSLLLECNVISNELQMSRWARTKALDVTSEVQRDILVTLVEMYEMETNDHDGFNSEELVHMDIVPTHLYPGEKTVHILFSTLPQGDVTIRLEGIPKRLPAKRYTQNTYTCELPEVGAGQKIISVYVEGISHSVYSTRIVIVTAEKLLENYVENLQQTFGGRNRSSTWVTMGLFFNPFSECFCQENIQIYYAQRIQEIWKNHHIQGQRDSGFSANEENFYESIHSLDEGSTGSDTSHGKHGNRKSESFTSFVKKVFRGGHKAYGKDRPKPKKLSRRVAKARSENMNRVPKLPENPYYERFRKLSFE